MAITGVKASRRRDGKTKRDKAASPCTLELGQAKKDILYLPGIVFLLGKRLGPQLDRTAARSPHHRIEHRHRALNLSVAGPADSCCVRLAEVSARQLPRTPMGGPPLDCSMGTLRGGYLALRIASFFYSSLSSSRGGSGVQYCYFFWLGYP